MIRSFDEKWMSRALSLAERGTLCAHPNPRVGCVIARGGRRVAEGWHEAFGESHAEAMALARAGHQARGATLYVTLEPCPHWGKTPPCAEALVRAGISRVVIAAEDPDPQLKGRGIRRLRGAGLCVEKGLFRRESEEMNRGFFRRHRDGRPWVILKMAQSLDGKIASRTGASRWISGDLSRRMVHRLRATSDAVLVGGETVRRDNPLLTSHGVGPDPLRVVLSASLRLNPRSQVFGPPAPTWVLTTRRGPSSSRKRLEKSGVLCVDLPGGKTGVRPADVLSCLGRRGVTRLLVEGGGETAESFVSAGAVDEVYLFIAPFFMGGFAAPTSLEGRGWSLPSQGPRLKNMTVRRLGSDVLIRGEL